MELYLIIIVLSIHIIIIKYTNSILKTALTFAQRVGYSSSSLLEHRTDFSASFLFKMSKSPKLIYIHSFS